jgi:hypothetical protein
MFTVSVAATDRNLLTIADVSAILGDSVVAQTPAIDTVLLQLSDMIARECGVPADGVKPPTLRRETIVETVRMTRNETALRLSRRFVDTVTSVVEDGTTLVTTDYEIDKAAGVLRRLDADGNVIAWPQAIVVCTYTAGFNTVPTDLKLAAIRVFQEQVSASARDPLLRSEEVEGVGKFDYWVGAIGGSKSTGSLSPVAAAMLDPYRTLWL